MDAKHDIDNEAGTAKAILQAAEEYLGSDTIAIEDGEHAIILPRGKRLESLKPILDQYRTAPERKKGTAAMTTLESFIAHVKRHADKNTALFAIDDRKVPALMAVYDYNESGEKGAPRFGEHRAVYSFPLSDEWQAWMKASASGPLSQAAFAEYLEDRIGDVMLPENGGDSIKEFAVNLAIDLATPQQLMTLSRGLKVHVDSRVNNAINLGSGEGQILFDEEHKNEAGVQLRVPGGFAIGIPVFRLGDKYQLPVRLRYRVDKGAGKVTWQIVVQRADVVFADAFENAAKQAADETGLPMFHGKPEV